MGCQGRFPRREQVKISKAQKTNNESLSPKLKCQTLKKTSHENKQPTDLRLAV
jgi:hypothetical protein